MRITPHFALNRGRRREMIPPKIRMIPTSALEAHAGLTRNLLARIFWITLAAISTPGTLDERGVGAKSPIPWAVLPRRTILSLNMPSGIFPLRTSKNE